MKSSQPNTSEQPPAISASSPRKNPCIGSDPNIAALEVIADDGISYLAFQHDRIAVKQMIFCPLDGLTYAHPVASGFFRMIRNWRKAARSVSFNCESHNIRNSA